MANSRRPTRRDGKAVVDRTATTQKTRAVRAAGEPNDDSPFALLRRQFERVEAQRTQLDRVLAREREARAEDAVELGEMMARVSLAEGRTRAAQEAADQLATQLEEERRAGSEREARQALMRTELETLRAEVTRSRAERPAGATEEPEATRAEASRLRESLAALQKRAAVIGAGLKEMRVIMVQSAALFDELEERERAIGEIRARSLREARAVFLRAAGQEQEMSGAPPVPARDKPLIEDLSDAAELLEDEVRRSMRPERTD
jgi:hypothetical protein